MQRALQKGNDASPVRLHSIIGHPANPSNKLPAPAGDPYDAGVPRGALLALILQTACRAPAPDADALVVLVESPPETLDRRFATSANAQRVASLVQGTLVRTGDDSEPHPELAESWAWTDARTLEFTLREGLSFADGRPLGASDVVCTYQPMAGAEFGSPFRQQYEGVEAIEALDARRVRFRLRAPSAPFLNDAMIMGIVPCGEARSRTPPGAGPYVVESWEDEEHLFLRANPRYWKGAPAIARVLVQTVRDETTRVLELLKGRADLAINAVGPPTLPALRASDRLVVETAPGSGFSYMAFNQRDPIAADLRVRRAVALALDREQLARAKFRGAARAADGMLAPEHWAFASDQRRWAYDPVEAARLLDEAGYPDPDGPDGPRPRFHLEYKTSTDRFRKSTALAIADMLRRVGVEVEVKAYEWGTFFGDVKRGRFQVCTLKWTPIVDPNLYRELFHSESIPTEANGWSGANRIGLVRADLDALLDRGRAELDRTARAAIYRDAQRLLAEELYYLPLFWEDTVVVRSRRLLGFRPSPHGYLHGIASARLEPR
jgi:peptide/nickel transport system substrate-binding protein